MSKKHACIEVDRSGCCFIQDLDSSNKTKKNQITTLKANVNYELKESDLVSFGALQFQFVKETPLEGEGNAEKDVAKPPQQDPGHLAIKNQVEDAEMKVVSRSFFLEKNKIF